MRTTLLTIAMITLSLTSMSASSIDDTTKPWNNTGKELTFRKGDTVKIKSGSKSAAYVTVGKVQHICNKSYIKVDGYFVAISDVEVITKYNTVR